MKKTLTLVAFAALAASASTGAMAADWSDTSISYRFGSNFAEPYIGDGIRKNIVNLTNVSGYKYGTNFVSVDLLNSDAKDGNAQEAYVVYRHTLDLGKVTGKNLAWGPVKGVGLTLGFDWNTKNDAGYGSRKRMLVAGPVAFINVPAGFLNVGVNVLNESNQSYIPTTANRHARYTYDTHAALSASWGIPVGATGWSFEGYADWIAAKGKDENGDGTVAEFHTDLRAMYDLSGVTSLPKNTLKAGVGYEYWRNKFGNKGTIAGTTARTPMVRVEYHF